jgi:L-asparaginase
VRLVPGFDDQILRHMIKSGAESGSLRALVLQLYGTGNAPSVKKDLVECLEEATEMGILVVASTQCHRGSVMMGHYATGQALERAGVVSSNDMTLEATSCKVAYLMGRGDLTLNEISNLMCVSMRGEVTHNDALPPPPFSSAYQRAMRKGRHYY